MLYTRITICPSSFSSSSSSSSFNKQHNSSLTQAVSMVLHKIDSAHSSDVPFPLHFIINFFVQHFSIIASVDAGAYEPPERYIEGVESERL